VVVVVAAVLELTCLRIAREHSECAQGENDNDRAGKHASERAETIAHG